MRGPWQRQSYAPQMGLALPAGHGCKSCCNEGNPPHGRIPRDSEALAITCWYRWSLRVAGRAQACTPRASIKEEHSVQLNDVRTIANAGTVAASGQLNRWI